jgi:hypothetical protein
VANLYGGNAAKLAAEMGAAVEQGEDEHPELLSELGWNASEVQAIRDGLRECSTTYGQVVHRERKLGDVNRLVYVGYRDQAVALLTDYRRWLHQNPEERRIAELGKFMTDRGIPEDATGDELGAYLAKMDDREWDAFAPLSGLDRPALDRLRARYGRSA